MNEKFEKIKSGLDQLNLILEKPRIYLYNYFSCIRNEVDITCELFINSWKIKQKKHVFDSDKFKRFSNHIKSALDHRALLIEKINNFEKECYDGLSSDGKLEIDLTFQLQKILVTVEAKICDPLWTEVNSLKVDELIYKMLSRLNKSIFMNSTMFFLKKKELSRLKIASFGMLVLIRGEFFSTRVIAKINDLWIHRFCFVNTDIEEEENFLVGFQENEINKEEICCLRDELHVSNMNKETIKTLYFNQYLMKHLENSNNYSPFNEINLKMLVQET